MACLFKSCPGSYSIFTIFEWWCQVSIINILSELLNVISTIYCSFEQDCVVGSVGIGPRGIFRLEKEKYIFPSVVSGFFHGMRYRPKRTFVSLSHFRVAIYSLTLVIWETCFDALLLRVSVWYPSHKYKSFFSLETRFFYTPLGFPAGIIIKIFLFVVGRRCREGNFTGY